ncbi:MAG TPA: NAD(+) diphosphatase [Casimicrobiaceae bacterium]
MLLNSPPGFHPGLVLPPQLPGNALCFVWREDKLLVREGEPPVLPTLDATTQLGVSGARHYLGSNEGLDCIVVRVAADAPEPPGWQWRGLRSLFLHLPDPLLALAGRAFQIAEWDRSHQFCGRCGAPTRDRANERAKECPACGHVVFPRVSPAMMVLVTRGRELLLARANRFPQAMYSALAGFVEPGESIEDCIHREVREEVNIEVDGLRYFASQSWAFPHSLMIAYTAEYAGGEMRPSDEEIADAQWFALDALPQLPSPVSIARRLIDATVAKLAAA